MDGYGDSTSPSQHRMTTAGTRIRGSEGAGEEQDNEAGSASCTSPEETLTIRGERDAVCLTNREMG